MLRDRATRILDVAVACGFKTQQHFAQVFRDVCGVSPTEYRQDFVGSEVTCAPETCSEDGLRPGGFCFAARSLLSRVAVRFLARMMHALH